MKLHNMTFGTLEGGEHEHVKWGAVKSSLPQWNSIPPAAMCLP